MNSAMMNVRNREWRNGSMKENQRSEKKRAWQCESENNNGGEKSIKIMK